MGGIPDPTLYETRALVSCAYPHYGENSMRQCPPLTAHEKEGVPELNKLVPPAMSLA